MGRHENYGRSKGIDMIKFVRRKDKSGIIAILAIKCVLQEAKTFLYIGKGSQPNEKTIPAIHKKK